MRRRRLLTGIGAACLSAVAGCGDQSEPTPTDTATATPTATATERPTATATATSTDTATPVPTPVAHQRGERFVVDEGGEPFAYTVRGFRRTDRLVTTSAPEGTAFLIVACTVENLQNESVPLPAGDIWLRAPDVRKSVSVSATNTADTDSRVEGDSLTDGPVPPGGPREGIVVFSNVPLGPTDYRLLFTPPGTTGPISDDPTRTHQVPVGSLRDVEPVE